MTVTLNLSPIRRCAAASVTQCHGRTGPAEFALEYDPWTSGMPTEVRGGASHQELTWLNMATLAYCNTTLHLVARELRRVRCAVGAGGGMPSKKNEQRTLSQQKCVTVGNDMKCGAAGAAQTYFVLLRVRANITTVYPCRIDLTHPSCLGLSVQMHD